MMALSELVTRFYIATVETRRLHSKPLQTTIATDNSVIVAFDSTIHKRARQLDLSALP